MDANTKLRRSPDASFEVVAGEAIVIHLKTGVYYSLNEIGTVFWKMVDGSRTVTSCAEEIAALSVDAPPIEVITADLIEVAEKLLHEELLMVM